MYKRAIVKTPGKSMIHGLSTSNLGLPDYKKALIQHENYIQALKECGLEVTVLEQDEHFPDSTFVEDVALLTNHCAIITNPGAPSRKGEIIAIKDHLKDFFENIEEVLPPGTVEGGDIMMVGSHFYIGISERTNLNGAEQVIRFLEKYGLSGSLIKLEKTLHLKTGVAYLEHNTIVACGEFLIKEEFLNFNILEIAEEESYAANCIWVNDKVLMPKGYPIARETIKKAGYQILEVDVSEFQKLAGGLSCLSLRF
ncbi:MAG: arginine deiminase family protein [Anaerolineales bacterium]|nr:arginine deiminase family protein [Anaerolineales bacterium]